MGKTETSLNTISIFCVVYSTFLWIWVVYAILFVFQQGLMPSYQIKLAVMMVGTLGMLFGGLGVLKRKSWARKLLVMTASLNTAFWLFCIGESIGTGVNFFTYDSPDPSLQNLLMVPLFFFSAFCINFYSLSSIKKQF
ncbi:MAG: hypothetical protein JW869_07345 [Candidatus Omnitrophica bacterium]|nr:hypothetical protein [Candidatus Omnitrophota bacterium]